ncbi:hypothetical protein G6F38_013469 [Rhizopus arrhizus]|nr:hypothetical protein G6F38_013469 [Rhizopus arrhizus]
MLGAWCSMLGACFRGFSGYARTILAGLVVVCSMGDQISLDSGSPVEGERPSTTSQLSRIATGCLGCP